MDVARRVALLVCVLVAAFSWIAPSTVQAQTQYYYGAPYILSGTYNADGQYSSIGAAANAWWAGYRIYWNNGYGWKGPLEQWCSYTVIYETPSPSDPQVAGFLLGGYCGGGNGLQSTVYTYDPGKNLGKTCNCIGDPIDAATATGPRTDTSQTTTYSYYLSSSATNCGTPGAACYQAGDLHTITDPQGHVTTTASYDGAGRITRTTDANGINTDLTYTPRGWLASRSVGGATTGFTYTPYGAVQTTTDPDGVTTTYGYDAAHRLVKVTDAQGNYVQYTLDAAGNKTAEQTYDASGTLHKSLTRSFNTLGQLTKVMDGLSHTIFDTSASNSYDANGNLVQSADGLGIQRQLGYDALNRLVQTLDNYNGTN